MFHGFCSQCGERNSDCICPKDADRAEREVREGRRTIHDGPVVTLIESTWLRFAIEKPRPPRKTCIVRIRSKKADDVLGQIEWRSGWRRYVFAPAADTVFDVACLNDIAAFIQSLMDERKKAKG